MRERVAVIGGSYIGTELSASFTKLGKQCELIMLEAVTLERFYGAEVGRFFQDTLTSHGVRVHGSQELERFEGSGDRVERVVTKSGLEIECDFVVIGAGVTPDITLAQRAGLETDSGVIVDRYLETSVPGVFAAGDIAEYDSVVHDRRLRIEHWDVAFNHGKYAALNMLGQKQEYDVVPYFWSDLADWASMEYVGPASDWDEIWIRGSIAAGKFTAFYVKDARVAAALTVGRSDDLDRGGAAAEGEDRRGRACARASRTRTRTSPSSASEETNTSRPRKPDRPIRTVGYERRAPRSRSRSRSRGWGRPRSCRRGGRVRRRRARGAACVMLGSRLQRRVAGS